MTKKIIRLSILLSFLFLNTLKAQQNIPDKAIKIKQTKNGILWGIMNIPQIASGLAIYRQENNIVTYEEADSYYFYVDFLLPEHQAIFDAYPELEITIENK